MSAMSEKARDAAKSKAERLTKDSTGKIDASGWQEPLGENGDIQTGPRPVSRRQFKRGGQVHGEAAKMHAGRKPRKGGGRANVDGGLINTDVKAENKDREGIKHVGGMKRGGKAHKDMGGGLALPAWNDAVTRKAGGRAKKMLGGPMEARRSMTPMGARVGNGAPGTATGHPFVQMRATGGKVHGTKCECPKCSGGAVSKARGGSTESNAAMIGARPEGGRTARASGGRAKKGAMNVNIIIASPKDKPMIGAPPGGISSPPPGAGPVGLHQGAPPPAMPPPGAAPPMGPPPMGRKSGGRAYPIESGAGGGLGRLEKARAYG